MLIQGDPDDDVPFAAALAAGARTIVSGDAPVLAVGSLAGALVPSISRSSTSA